MKSSYSSFVTMSPAELFTRHRAPSITCQPSEMVSFLKFRQPSVVLPSNSSFQPAAFSASVSVFRFGRADAGCPSAWSFTRSGGSPHSGTAAATNTDNVTSSAPQVARMIAPPAPRGPNTTQQHHGPANGPGGDGVIVSGGW